MHSKHSTELPELKKASELAAEIQGKSVESAVEDGVDPRDQREYSFNFSHKDRRGKTWRGSFINQILTIRQRQQAKVLKAQLSGGVPIQALDADIWALNEMVAHMTISLIKRPDWAEELTDLLDEDLIDALYKEVASHEAFFYRRAADNSAG